ncbi:hypothetical protein E4U43_000016 [Claviceps pusilla]|uniref:N-acetyltransferase domain-containing protein n=1 Tax=Claviceps pusilla TaxID=123648 RepID=A0A9P7NCQ5_9HYPO|nr:hypothetical protein E4U43_000016 [Claviceps pusilla]
MGDFPGPITTTTAAAAAAAATTTTITCRKAVPADAAAVQRLVKSAFRGESSRAGWTTEADLVADERIDVAGVAAKIQGPGIIVVAHALAHAQADDGSGNALVGCCEIEAKANGIGYFGLFAVDPKRQAGGLGKQILARAEVMAREELGVRIMEMTVIWTRTELIAWYLRRGYVKTGRTAPFPYAHLYNGKALRDDLYFVVLEKKL